MVGFKGHLRSLEKKKDMLKKQLWMAIEDEFFHLKSRMTEVKRLTLKYKWKVIFSYGTYMLEGEINFPPSEIWSLIQESEYNEQSYSKETR